MQNTHHNQLSAKHAQQHRHHTIVVHVVQPACGVNTKRWKERKKQKSKNVNESCVTKKKNQARVNERIKEKARTTLGPVASAAVG